MQSDAKSGSSAGNELGWWVLTLTGHIMIRLVFCAVAGLAACTPVPMSPERAADLCEAQARAAQGPTGRIAVGVNSNSGPFTNAEIGISGDYLAGRDPVDVYTQCVIARTGTGPIRPPRLR